MNASLPKNTKIISYTFAFILIIIMVTASVIMKDPEVILPEIAAMAIAMWVYRDAGWIRQPSKIFIAPSVTAGIGFAVNQFNISYLGKVILTLILIMLFLRIIKSNLAPSIATGLLPLVMNSVEWTFMLSVFFFAFILMLGVLTLGLNKGIEKKVRIQYKYMNVFLLFNFIWIGLIWIVGFPQLAVIPPVLVVVYEVLQKPMYNGKMAVKQVVSLTISATVGSFLYFTIDSWIIITILSLILMLILLRIVGIRLPAVYAFPLIPFVFPEEIVAKLPIAAFIASVFFFGSVLAYKKLEKIPRSKINQVNE